MNEPDSGFKISDLFIKNVLLQHLKKSDS